MRGETDGSSRQRRGIRDSRSERQAKLALKRTWPAILRNKNESPAGREVLGDGLQEKGATSAWRRRKKRMEGLVLAEPRTEGGTWAWGRVLPLRGIESR